MHYFQGMEVWQNANRIFLGQGKYAVEILKRFGMMYCKAMTTPMETNLKLLSDASSKTVDATMYRHMIGSLMYLTNMRPYICFAVNTLSQFLTDPRHIHLYFLCIVTRCLFRDVSLMYLSHVMPRCSYREVP